MTIWERAALTLMVMGFCTTGVMGQDDADATVMPDEGMMEDMDMDMNMTMTDMPTGDDMGNITAPTMSPTIATFPPSTADGCYTSLDAIYFLIEDDDMLFQQKRFVICPGTVLEIGFLVPGVGIDQGQAPFIPRSNSEFLCGEDGKSENNCIVKGGDFGLIAVPVFFRQDLSVNNVQLKGFTFEGQVQYAAFIATSGDISFIDCIIRNSANFGPFVFNYDASLDIGRRLEEEDEEHDPWLATIDYIEKYRAGTLPKRRLADTVHADSDDMEDKDLRPVDERALQGKVFESTIRDCLFTNLQQVERKLGVEFGVVSVKGPDHVVKIEDCTFANNQYGNQDLTPIGYGVLMQGGSLTLDSVCFVDNDFRGNGAVLLEQTADPFAPDADFFTGNYATDDENVDCPFAAYFATDEDRRNSNFTCVPVQTSECGGEPVDTPAVAPTDPPAEIPDGSGDGDGGSADNSGASSLSSGLFLVGLYLGMLAMQCIDPFMVVV